MTEPVFPRVPPECDAIGGYFGLELPPAADAVGLRGAMAFQSATSAWHALLAVGRPSAVHMPWYICDSMLEPLAHLGIPVRRYAQDDRFRPLPDVRLAEREWLLCVNLFGLNRQLEDEVRDRFGPENVVFDHAHALFAAPGLGIGTVASPRKFVGVPDGGLLWTGLPVFEPAEEDTGSADRGMFLLQRAGLGAEAGFSAFREADVSTNGQAPLAMSRLTRRMLGSISNAAVTERRRRNYGFLHEMLGSLNQLALPELGDQVPLCYPLLPARPVPRSALHKARIYVPGYWSHLLEDHLSVPDRERRWAAELLPLPVDQRLDIDQIDTFLVQPLRAFLRPAAR
jgi:hypothetical protein